MRRTTGRNNADISKIHFWRHYRDSVENPVERKVFDKVFRELFEGFSETMINDAASIKLSGLGDFRIRAFRPNRFDKEGNLNMKSLKVNWKATWAKWRELYPNVPDEKMKEIEGKPLIHHLNEHSDGYSFELIWEKQTVSVKGKSCYQFKPSRKNNRARAKAVISEGKSYYE